MLHKKAFEEEMGQGYNYRLNDAGEYYFADTRKMYLAYVKGMMCGLVEGSTRGQLIDVSWTMLITYVLALTPADRHLFDEELLKITNQKHLAQIAAGEEVPSIGVNTLTDRMRSMVGTMRTRGDVQSNTIVQWYDMMSQWAEDAEGIRCAGFKEAYRKLGIEDDGEYRWKWLLLEIGDLKKPFQGEPP